MDGGAKNSLVSQGVKNKEESLTARIYQLQIRETGRGQEFGTTLFLSTCHAHCQMNSSSIHALARVIFQVKQSPFLPRLVPPLIRAHFNLLLREREKCPQLAKSSFEISSK